MEDRNMDKLAREFAKELYKIFGIIPDYDFDNENRVLECTRKWSNYARAIGYEEGNSQVAHRKRVKQIKDGKIVAIYDSVKSAASAMQIDKRAISKVLTGKRNRTAGFEWDYA